MRKAEIKRKTKETDIFVKLNIDGKGISKINTSIGLLDHMLDLFAFHGLFDLEITAKGDLQIDIHHTNEDVGIVLGQAFKKALGDMAGIRRFGSSSVPMEDVVAEVTADISGRGHLSISGYTPVRTVRGATEQITEAKLTFQDFQHFFESFCSHAGVNVNIALRNPSEDIHTLLEPIFKALGVALDQATQIDPRRKGVPSTKGIID